jgi:RNA polymerase sigma-70 factor (ECF subfamily)
MAELFPETRWSMILRLGSASDPQRHAAFADLCASYWRPLYVYARSLGHQPPDAEDLVQGFLAQLIARDEMGALSPERGRMRTYLKAALRHHLIDGARRAGAQRRGGGATHLSLETESLERALLTRESPDVDYDRYWTRALLDRSLARLREKYAAAGKEALFAELEPHLTGDSAPAYARLAQKLGSSETSLRAAVHRLRAHFRVILRAEVAETLGPGEDPEAELRYLMGAWQSGR